MIITASQIYARQAPRKVRLVANTIKSLPLIAAFQQLGVINREASILVLKVLRQAVANATHNHGLKPEDLVIKNIRVDGGSLYKRFRAVSRGRAHAIVKKTCHVTVELMDKSETKSETKTESKTVAAASESTAPKKAVKKKADK